MDYGSGYYYVVIGGYAVDIAQAPQILFPGNLSLLTFTTSDLRLLAGLLSRPF